MKRKNTAFDRRRRASRETGQSLVEVLVSLTVGFFVVSGLIGTMTQTMSFSTALEHRVIVNDLAQQVLDNLRNLSYNELVNNISATPYTLLLNKTVSGQVGPTFMPRAMLLDEVTYNWTSNSLKNSFSNNLTSIQVTLAGVGAANPPTSILATVNIYWREGIARNSNITSGKSFTAQTLISQQGIHQ